MLMYTNEHHNSTLSTLSSIKRFRIILQFSFIIFYTVFASNFLRKPFLSRQCNLIKNYIEHEHENLTLMGFEDF